MHETPTASPRGYVRPDFKLRVLIPYKAIMAVQGSSNRDDNVYDRGKRHKYEQVEKNYLPNTHRTVNWPPLAPQHFGTGGGNKTKIEVHNSAQLGIQNLLNVYSKNKARSKVAS